MKRLFTIVLFIVGVIISNSASAQVFREGNIGVDIYYGTPTLFQRIFKAGVAAVTDSFPDAKVDYNGLGPIGIRGEYMVSDKIGVGLDLGYNQLTVTNTHTETVVNSSTGVTQNVTYSDKITTGKFGVMGTLNIHLVEEDPFDLAVAIGLGYGRRTYTFDPEDPTFDENQFTFGGILFPFAMKVGVEARYFFTPNFGLNLGLGLGQGGLAHGGLALKF